MGYFLISGECLDYKSFDLQFIKQHVNFRLIYLFANYNTWLAAKMLHKILPKIQSPLKVYQGVIGTATKRTISPYLKKNLKISYHKPWWDLQMQDWGYTCLYYYFSFFYSFLNQSGEWIFLEGFKCPSQWGRVILRKPLR